MELSWRNNKWRYLWLGQYKWERISKIFNTKIIKFFYNGIIADDIIQGGLGDCYFLNAISALCKFPNLVRKLFYFK